MIAILISGGCGGSPEIETGQVTLFVTKDFGKRSIYKQQIELDSKKSVMEILNEHLDIKTAYGGGFVNSINGLESGYTNNKNQERIDWFYFINGIMTNIGAVEYFPSDGDVIWWDYHPWGNISFSPAVTGAFPQPFLNGYQDKNDGTLILAGEECIEPAISLQEYFAEIGVKEIALQNYQEKLATDRSEITVIIALWEELSQSSFWRGMQENRDKTGWFAELEHEVFYSLDTQGKRQDAYYENVGVILASGMGMGDNNPLWLITGLDMDGIIDAIDLLVNRGSSIAGSFGVLVYEQEVILLPIQ